MHPNRAQIRSHTRIDGLAQELEIESRNSSADDLRRRIAPMDRRHRLAHESRIFACVRLWRPEPLDVGLVPDLMTDIPALEVQRRCLGKMRKSGNVSCGSRD